MEARCFWLVIASGFIATIYTLGQQPITSLNVSLGAFQMAGGAIKTG